MSWRSMEIVSEEEESGRKKDHPLFWIVETLADFRPVRTDFIDELMNMVSDSPEALFARERLALRHLEDLFGVPDANDMDPNWKAKKFGFEERAEDVHRRVLQEMKLPSSSSAAPLESCKWDIHQFILNKRASLPQCTIQQLEEALIEDLFPSTPLLKEQSELFEEQEQENECLVLSVDANAATTTRILNDTEENKPGCLNVKEQCPDVEKSKEFGELKSMEHHLDTLVSSGEKCHQDSLEADWTENSLCIKCNRGGELLICSVSSCPIIVHESCLDSSASFDDMGDFYCPVCDFAKAKAAYEEAKRKLSLIKEKAAMARKHFVTFIQLIDVHHKNEPSEISPTETSNQVSHVREQEAKVAADCSNALFTGAPLSSDVERNGALTEGALQNQGSSHEDDRLVKNEESVSACSDELLPGKEETTPFRSDVSLSTESSKENIDEQHEHNIVGKERQCAKIDVASFHCLDPETVTNNQVCPDVGTKNLGGPSPPLNVNAAEIPVHSPCVDMETVSEIPKDDDMVLHSIASEQDVSSPQGQLSQLNVNLTEIFCNPHHIDSWNHLGLVAKSAALRQLAINSPQGPSSPVKSNEKETSNTIDLPQNPHNTNEEESAENKELSGTIDSPPNPHEANVEENVEHKEISDNLDSSLNPPDANELKSAEHKETSGTFKSPLNPHNTNEEEIAEHKETTGTVNSPLNPRDAYEEEISEHKETAGTDDSLLNPHNADEEEITEHNASEEELSETAEDAYEFKRRKLPSMRFSSDEVTSSRRRKTPWTSEEEAILKEGVEKFADHKNVPWKKILEFGRGVFSKSRKAVDLKEKWRRL